MPIAQNVLDRYNNAYNYLYNKKLLPPNVRQNFQVGEDFPEYVDYLDSLAQKDQQKGNPALGRGLAPDELTTEGYKLLSRDKGRLSGTNYPVYKGPTTSPMSALTQRSRELRDQFTKKPSPYSQKIQSVLTRDNQGISGQDIQGLLNNLSAGQRQFGQGSMLDVLKNQFLSSYDPRVARFTHKGEKDINRFLPEASGKLQDISRVSGNLEGSRNQQIARTLQGLQADKQARREALVGSLDQFGNQRHAYTNMVNAANKGQFQQEANEPYRKMQMLEGALEPHRASFGEDVHPDLNASKASDISQAIKAYNMPSTRYPGQLVANLPAEIEASGNVLGRLSPSLKDNYTDKRKALTRSLVDNPNLSSTALGNLPPAMAGQVSNLEQQAKDRMKKELAALNNQYIKLGQYGSEQHMGAAEQRAREINKAVLEQRDRILQNSLKEQLQLQHGTEVNNIRQLGMIGGQSHKDYGDFLKSLHDTNKLGATKFGNDQAENEELYKNYQNEKLWQWPHMRNSIRNEAFGDIFGGLASKNISLENLANLNTNYSELEKERNQYRTDLTSMQAARDQLQSQLGIKRRDEEQQRGQQNAQVERQRQQAEVARLQGLESDWNRLSGAYNNYPPFQESGYDKSNPFAAYQYMQSGQRGRDMQAYEGQRRQAFDAMANAYKAYTGSPWGGRFS